MKSGYLFKRHCICQHAQIIDTFWSRLVRGYMIRRRIVPLLVCAILIGSPTAVAAEDFVSAAFDVVTEADVTYGEGVIGASSATPQSRDLKLDLYRPASNGELLEDRPAVILAFGGAYHRGSKGTIRFEEDGASDTPMGEYCAALAAAGYVCMSIEYRLVPEDPAPPSTLGSASLYSKETLSNPAAVSRVELIRARMGLAPLDDLSREQLWNTILSSTEDLIQAVEFSRTNAKRLGLDPDRIAIGGFSAGAITAINAAYGRGVPVQGVISLSGGLIGFDLSRSAVSGMPPGLFFIGQNDLQGMQIGTRSIVAILQGADIRAESAWIPGFGHFYPMGAPSLGSDLSKTTVKRRILEFLDQIFDHVE
ncbi:alpha/beta hydrolase [Erythrobacter sp. Dej080120_24]|uniref:alpha/beta hydrolase n=1 Tax=Erythrobacter sp. Dej080120_24 TaxID=3024837 RepID=UPI0030C6D029